MVDDAMADDTFRVPFSESLLSDFENSMDTLPGTPTSLKTATEADMEMINEQMTTTRTPSNGRRDGRIKSETILSRVGSFVSISEAVTIDDLFEYDWADSDTDLSSDKLKESYIVQEILADFLKIKSFKRKYPDLSRRTMDAYERSWLQQEGLVPLGRADLGLTALRTDEVMKLLACDYPEVHAEISDLFRRRRIQKASELQKRQYEAARIERGEARAEAARRRAIDSVTDFNHRLIGDRFKSRRCYWDLQTMQIHVPQPGYRLLESPPYPKGAYPVAVIPGQFAEHYTVYTPERLMHLPLSRCVYSQPVRKHRPAPALPTNLCFGKLDPRPIEQPDSKLRLGEDDGCDSTENINDKLSEDTKHGGDRLMESTYTSSPRILPGDLKSPRLEHSSTPIKTDSVTISSDPVSCAACKAVAKNYLRCSQCGYTGHPHCLDISDAMLPSVKSYSWLCMECKCCVKCNDSGQEEQMMFCDLCDRGYHAFCVGLKSIPEGQWECPLCVKTPKTAKRGRKSGVVKEKPEGTIKRPRKAFKKLNDNVKSKDEQTPKRRRSKKVIIDTSEDTSMDDDDIISGQRSPDSFSFSTSSAESPKKRRGRPPSNSKGRPSGRGRGRPRLSTPRQKQSLPKTSSDNDASPTIHTTSSSIDVSEKQLSEPRDDVVKEDIAPPSSPTAPIVDVQEENFQKKLSDGEVIALPSPVVEPFEEADSSGVVDLKES